MDTIETTDIRSGHGRKLVFIPGWIGWGSNWPQPSQCRPLLDGAFKDFATITAIDFKGPHSPTRRIAMELSEVIEKAADGQPTTIFGVSYGAQMAIRALELCPRLDVRPILVDPPSGGDSLVKLDQLKLVKQAQKIGELPEWLNHGPTQAMFKAAFLCGLGKNDPIDVPQEVKDAGEEAQYIEQVRKDAFDGQQGFPLTLCAEQLSAMAKAADDTRFQAACRDVSNTYGDQIVRILCVGNNAVVISKESDRFYNVHLPKAHRVVVGQNHADFIQYKTFWNNFLVEYV